MGSLFVESEPFNHAFIQILLNFHTSNTKIINNYVLKYIDILVELANNMNEWGATMKNIKNNKQIINISSNASFDSRKPR
jgi:hypothetical protein